MVAAVANRTLRTGMLSSRVRIWIGLLGINKASNGGSVGLWANDHRATDIRLGRHGQVGKRSTLHQVLPGHSKLFRLVSIGAGEGIRTLDPDLGKVVLYP